MYYTTTTGTDILYCNNLKTGNHIGFRIYNLTIRKSSAVLAVAIDVFQHPVENTVGNTIRLSLFYSILVRYFHKTV